jgi:hypothetical protein
MAEQAPARFVLRRNATVNDSTVHRRVREDVDRGCRESDYQRRLAQSPQRMRERDNERDVYLEDKRAATSVSSSPLYRMCGRSSKPSMSN